MGNCCSDQPREMQGPSEMKSRKPRLQASFSSNAGLPQPQREESRPAPFGHRPQQHVQQAKGFEAFPEPSLDSPQFVSSAKPGERFGFGPESGGPFGRSQPTSNQQLLTSEQADSLHTSSYQLADVSPFDQHLRPPPPAEGRTPQLASNFLGAGSFGQNSGGPVRASMFFSEFQTRSKSPGARSASNAGRADKQPAPEPPAKRDRSAEFQKISLLHADDCPEPATLLAKTASMLGECDAVRITRDELGLGKYPLRSAAPEEGPFLVSDGGSYFGQLKDGRQEGRGRWVSADGELYEGYWQGGLFHGEGRYISKKGDIYQGDWAKGRREGKGILQAPDGYLYRGEWRRDLPHGKGYERDARGNSYEGGFEAGVKRGSAVVRNVAERFVYEGEVQDGHFEGRGTRR